MPRGFPGRVRQSLPRACRGGPRGGLSRAPGAPAPASPVFSPPSRCCWARSARSNFVENRIRPLKLTAKNALFAGHDEGAAAWARIASLIETCKMNGVEPHASSKVPVWTVGDDCRGDRPGWARADARNNDRLLICEGQNWTFVDTANAEGRCTETRPLFRDRTLRYCGTGNNDGEPIGGILTAGFGNAGDSCAAANFGDVHLRWADRNSNVYYCDGSAWVAVALRNSVPDFSPSFGDTEVEDRSYTVSTAIDSLVLPAAEGGDGTLTYTLAPLPAGLVFTASTRTLSGTPSATGTTTATYTATDADTTGADTDTLSFQIAVASTVTLSAPSRVTEGSSVTVTATLSAPLSSAVTIPVTVSTASPNTAEPGDVGTLTSISIGAGATSGTGTIAANHDADEADETFTVSLGSTLPSSVVAGSRVSVRVRIVDDEGHVLVSFARAAMTLCEAGPTKTLDINLSRRPSRSSVLLPLVTKRVTSEWRDHDHIYSTSIYWTPNAWFNTPIKFQAYADGDTQFEEFTVEIDESRMPEGFVAVAPKKATVTIVDDDLYGRDGCDQSSARMSVEGDRAFEGHDGFAEFTVTIDREPWTAITVNYRTVNGTAVAGQDYVAKSGTLTFPVPDSHDPTTYGRSRTVRVPILDDNVEDSGETFRLVLSNPQGAVLKTAEAIGTIFNEEDHGAETELTAAFERVPARHGGTQPFWFDLRFKEALGETANAPAAASFAVEGGRIRRVWKIEAGLWRLQVAPEAWRNVTVTLAGGRGCDTAGAVCTADGRALANSPVAAVASAERPLSADANLSGLALEAGTDGSWTALDIGAFAAGTTRYAATVPYGTTHARLRATAAHARATLKAGASGSPSAVASGSSGAAVALAVGANALAVEVTAEDGARKTYTVTVTREAARPLTAAFENVPVQHDGGAAFALDVRFSEALGGGTPPAPASFKVRAGSVTAVERVSAGLWRVRVTPKKWKDVTVTLAGGRACTVAGAVCASGGRRLTNTLEATVGGPVRIRIEGARAREGKDESLDFAVTLNRAAAHEVSVDYATADGTATAGADYTAVSGTLVFAAGETAKTVSVPVLDDAVDEGRETMRLVLSNPQGAYLRNIHRQATGIIRNDDALQQAWLARFGRTVGGHVTDAVSDRLLGGLAPGAHATLAGQNVDLSRAEDGKALADTMTGLARAFGAPDAPADDSGSQSGAGAAGDPFALTRGPSAAATAPAPTGRELLVGSAFHVAGAGEGSGPVLAAWGRVAHGSFDGEAASDAGRLGLDGAVVTGTLGADADWGRMLAGVAVSFSDGEGTFADSGAGDRGSIESRMTVVSPYARFRVSERVSAWGLAGFGSGGMTVVQDARAATETRPARARTETKADLSMRMGAAGARGALLEQGTAGMDLALKADAMSVRTESEKAAGSAATEADASRLRLVLEGGRAFEVGGGGVLRPSLELGVRHDGGDAETGAGVELGGGVSYTDTASGLSIEAKGRMLAAHADSDYEEWGASATARLDPGERGRGLSFSLSPTVGATSSATERLWGARDARGLAPGTAFEAARGLTAEAGYGLALFGDRFTGTPNLGFGLSDTARAYRIGWRLTSALRGDPGFEVRLDATRRKPAHPGSGAGAGSRAEHGAMLRSSIRW